MINITINGDNHSFEKAVSIEQLLCSLDIVTTKVAVEKNLEIVPKSQFSSHFIEDGDRLEIVHFIGGG